MKHNHGLGTLLTLNALVGSASGIMLLALPLYALSLNASAAELGLIGGMAGAGRMLIIVPSGMWIDRIGTRRLFTFSTLLCAVLSALLPLTQRPVSLMAIVFFQGMTQSISFLALQAGFLNQLRHMNASQAGWQRCATQLGFYLAGPLAGAAMISDGEFIPVFLMVSALFLIGAVMVIFHHAAGINDRIHPIPPATGTSGIKQVLAFLENRNLRCVLAIEFLGAAVFMIYRTFMAPVALEALNLTPRSASWLVITQGTTAMCLLFWGDGLVRNRSATWTFITASLLIVAGNALLAKATGFVSAWLGSLTYGAGSGFLSYVSLTRLTKVEGEKGKIAALFSLSVALGNILGPVAAGYTVQFAGLQGAFMLPAGMMLAILAVFYRYFGNSRPALTERTPRMTG